MGPDLNGITGVFRLPGTRAGKCFKSIAAHFYVIGRDGQCQHIIPTLLTAQLRPLLVAQVRDGGAIRIGLEQLIELFD